jgi:hypothetical protein
MAKEKEKPKGERGARYNALYPWDDWFSKPKKRVVRQRDFKIGSASMSQQIRQAASKRGISVSLEEVEDGFIINVTGR